MEMTTVLETTAMPVAYNPKKYVSLSVEVEEIPDLMEIMKALSAFGKISRISYENY